MICALKPQSTTSRASLRYIAHFSEVMDSQGCRRDPDPTLKTFCSNVPLKACRPIFRPVKQFGTIRTTEDRKSTRLNSSHVAISYAVFCLKKEIMQHLLLSQPQAQIQSL